MALWLISRNRVTDVESGLTSSLVKRAGDANHLSLESRQAVLELRLRLLVGVLLFIC